MKFKIWILLIFTRVPVHFPFLFHKCVTWVKDVSQEEISTVLSQLRASTRPKEKAKSNPVGPSGMKNTFG